MRWLRLLARAAVMIWRRVERVLDLSHLPAAYLRRNRHFVTATHSGGRVLADARQVAIFVHFDAGGEVHDYVLFYLRALRDAGFDIVLVSNGSGLTKSAFERVAPLCASVLYRENVGYDFGAYRDGLHSLGDLSRFRRILLANDSVYGPLFDLPSVLAGCDDPTATWGMTDSWSGRYHLQSYFMLLGPSAFLSERFKRFWDTMLLVQSKRYVIRKYEIGFTQALLRAGVTCTALFPYRQIASDLMKANSAGAFREDELPGPVVDFFGGIIRRVERGTPLNPMHQFWDRLIGDLRCPFIKRELLARNPARIPHAHLWERVIRGVSSYDTDLIVRHLQVVTRDRAP